LRASITSTADCWDRLPADALGRGPDHADAVIDAHEKGSSIVAAEAEVCSTVAGEQAPQEGAVRGDDAHAAGAGGEDVPLGIAFHAVNTAPLGRREFPFLGADEGLAMGNRATLQQGGMVVARPVTPAPGCFPRALFRAIMSGLEVRHVSMVVVVANRPADADSSRRAGQACLGAAGVIPVW
jgi:hypothetical protein